MTSPLRLEWTKGGHGAIVSLEGDQVVLSSTIPSPPGSTLEGRLGGEGETLRVKVRGCRKEDAEGEAARFRIEGRFVNLTKAARAGLGR